MFNAHLTNFMKNLEESSDALDYLYTIGCVKGIYHHDANTQWNIEDHTPVEYILDECGDEIFKDADSIAIEIDTDREIVKKTFAYAEKYNKKVYANTYFDNTINDWTERFEITSTGIKTNFASALYSYKDDYDLDYYACK